MELRPRSDEECALSVLQSNDSLPRGRMRFSMSPPEHNPWEARRLMLSLGLCTLLIIAAVVFERCS